MSLELDIFGDAPEAIVSELPTTNRFVDVYELPDLLGQPSPNVSLALNVSCLVNAVANNAWDQASGCAVLDLIWEWLARPVRISLWPFEVELPWLSVEEAARDVVNQTLGVSSAAVAVEETRGLRGWSVVLIVLASALVAVAMGVLCAAACCQPPRRRRGNVVRSCLQLRLDHLVVLQLLRGLAEPRLELRAAARRLGLQRVVLVL